MAAESLDTQLVRALNKPGKANLSKIEQLIDQGANVNMKFRVHEWDVREVPLIEYVTIFSYRAPASLIPILKLLLKKGAVPTDRVASEILRLSDPELLTLALEKIS